ncbi:Na/Pi symporter [Bdellovibrio bacteriovorus]|uniref:Na/Pi symporter n=1 Tax=Bdellovibrio bacteriovorus TaxID=959 RepID=UPI00345BA5EE
MIDSGNSYFILLVSGVALFLYGMSMASSSLEKLMAGKITGLLNHLSQSKFLAILTGVVLTTLMQSSGAVTSMLVGLGSARVVNLRQVMGVIIGTAIGTTLTVQLISLDLTQYALPVFTLAFAFYFKAKKNSLQKSVPGLHGVWPAVLRNEADLDFLPPLCGKSNVDGGLPKSA